MAGALQAVFVMLGAAHASAFPVPVGTAAGRGVTGLVELMVPPLAGLAVAIVAPAPLLILDAVSFLASALLVRATVRTWFDRTRSNPADPTSPPRHRLRSGLRFMRCNLASRRWAFAGTLHTAAAGAYLAMLLPWADRHLGVAALAGGGAPDGRRTGRRRHGAGHASRRAGRRRRPARLAELTARLATAPVPLARVSTQTSANV